MSYRHVDTLLGREALVAARIERAWWGYRISVLLVTGTIKGGDVTGNPIAISYALTRDGAFAHARRILGAVNV